MISDKRNLNKVASEWLQLASMDVSRLINECFEKQGWSIEEMANFLSISTQELEELIQGNITPSLKTFAKIHIMCGNVLEIKPLLTIRGNICANNRPLHHMEEMEENDEIFPNLGGRFIGEEECDEESEDMEVEPNIRKESCVDALRRRMGGMPIRRRMGGMPILGQASAPRKPKNFTVSGSNDCGLDSFNREQLVNIIKSKGWENDIDMELARRSDLINFIASKHEHNAKNAIKAERESVKKNNVLSEDAKKQIAKLMEFIEMNPDLKGYVKENPFLAASANRKNK